MRLTSRLAVAAVFAASYAAGLSRAGVPGQGIGWRGDGSGRFPDADPPTVWSRLPVGPMRDIRASSTRPTGDGPGDARPVADGVLTDWLVLGPFDAPQPPSTLPAGRVDPEQACPALGKEFIADEATVQPAAGDKAGELAWKSWTVAKADRQWSHPANMVSPWCSLSFDWIWPGFRDKAAYAHAYIYVADAGKAGVNLRGANIKLWVNGKPLISVLKCQDPTRLDIELIRGWNRLLIKNTGNFSIRLLPAGDAKYENHNIRWMTKLPGYSYASPIVVGHRLFACVEGATLICLDKTDGRILWSKSSSLIDCLTDEEKANPVYREKIEPLLKSPSEAWKAEGMLKEISKEKYDTGGQIQRGGSSCMTPTSDGTLVFATFGNGQVVCYDMDGNRKWIAVHPHPTVQHDGHAASPLLVGDKLVVLRNYPVCYEKTTGKVLWATKDYGSWTMGSPIVTKVGDTEVLVLGNGSLIRLSDGKVLCRKGAFEDGTWCWSPIAGDGMYFGFTGKSTDRQFTGMKLPETCTDEIAPQVAYRVNAPHMSSSPLLLDGIAYIASPLGLLSAVDAKTGTIIYQQQLAGLYPDMDSNVCAMGITASILQVGKYLYITDNAGRTAVVQPGRQFKQVATNPLVNILNPRAYAEGQEGFLATSTTDGKCLYFRGSGNMYCVGE